jgi:hypothetical protein
MFLMSSQVKKFSHRKLRDKKHQHFSTVSLPTDSVIVDHPENKLLNIFKAFSNLSTFLMKRRQFKKIYQNFKFFGQILDLTTIPQFFAQ